MIGLNFRLTNVGLQLRSNLCLESHDFIFFAFRKKVHTTVGEVPHIPRHFKTLGHADGLIAEADALDVAFKPAV